MTWILAASSLVGVWLNIHHRRECFVIWMFTNASWCAYDMSIGAYAQGSLMGVYFGLAVYGFIKWKGVKTK